MALQLTIQIYGAEEDTDASQEELNELADHILAIADKHAEFTLFRIGDVMSVSEEDE